MIDYPFNTWKTYFYALKQFLGKQHYYRRLPKYGEQHENPNIKTEIKIVEELLKYRANPQEGLDGFIKVLLTESEYVSDIRDQIPKIIDLFITAGAKPNIDSLFTLNYPNDNDFKSEVKLYESRGILIDTFSKYGLVDKNKYYDWSSIEAIDWDFIDQKVINNNYQQACFIALKGFSNYLDS